MKQTTLEAISIKHEGLHLALAIVAIEHGIEDKVKYKFVQGNSFHGFNETEVFEATLQYEEDGRAYFVTEDDKYYLDQFTSLE